MTSTRSLAELVTDPGFTPGKKHFRELIEVALSKDEDVARSASGALSRAQDDLGALLEQRFDVATPIEQHQVVRLAGRLAQTGVHTRLFELLARALTSSDPRVRRTAGSAIGRARMPGGEALLVRALAAEGDASVRRHLVEALGKVGGKQALAVLEDEGSRATDDATMFQVTKATARVARTSLRESPSKWRMDAGLGPLTVCFVCRQGLERVVRDEVTPLGAARASKGFGEGRVDLRYRGPIQNLFRSRAALRFGFALPASVVTSAADRREAVVSSLSGPSTVALLTQLTDGPIRYRLAVGGAGKRRRLVWDLALEVGRRAPTLVNDPTNSAWDAVVTESTDGGLLRVELFPNLPDTRFAYRAAEVPAASHPTIAAALARVAGVRGTDVVWDPFVGSGLELAERSLLGPYARLIGTDVEDGALAAARANLEGAGATFELHREDALTFDPPGGLSLIVTNPPMGRRTLQGAAAAPLLVGLIERAARRLIPGGRLVWLSPSARDTRAAAESHGLRLADAWPVDLGGLAVELQHFVRPNE